MANCINLNSALSVILITAEEDRRLGRENMAGSNNSKPVRRQWVSH